MNLLGRLVALWSLLRAWRRRHDAPPPGTVDADPTERTVPEDRRAETLTAGLLWASGLCAVAFLVLYVVWDDTRILGVAGGLCLLFLAAALMFASARVVPQETAVEERAELDAGPEEHRALTGEIRRGGEGISRRKLLAAAGTASAAGLGVIIVTPAASLGPRVRKTLTDSPWAAGRRLVDEDDQPIRADDLAVGSFTTAFPEGADKRDLGSPVIVLRVRPDEVHASPRRADWSPDGVFAYSKICTHAGCAISEFRYPLFEQDTNTGPALVCPCHYSTFDPTRGAEVIFGPAGRPLPQLPLRVDADGALRAGGGLSDAPGPAWWGTKGPSS
jgi:ubiquinol-cytochrome c reductase iron-sulfur subunit